MSMRKEQLMGLNDDEKRGTFKSNRHDQSQPCTVVVRMCKSVNWKTFKGHWTCPCMYPNDLWADTYSLTFLNNQFSVPPPTFMRETHIIRSGCLVCLVSHGRPRFTTIRVYSTNTPRDQSGCFSRDTYVRTYTLAIRRMFLVDALGRSRLWEGTKRRSVGDETLSRVPHSTCSSSHRYYTHQFYSNQPVAEK